MLLGTLTALSLTASAQTTADEVMNVTRRVNDYFMQHYEDPTVPTNWRRIRPSSLWTRAVYYEGLMALYDIDPQQRYIDYTDRWADFHQWTPRKMFTHVKENIEHQMVTSSPKNQSLYGWWTWIDAIQMAMPIYMQMYRLTGDSRYRDHGMKMYRWSRNECGGGLFNTKEGLWWRDADYVPPYKEPDGKQCYWSRGNGWVYAALVRCMNELPKKDKAYKELKKDFMLMSEALRNCQREDGFWNPSLVSTNYAMPETSGTGLFLYGICWGIQQGYLKAEVYRPVADRAWAAIAKNAVHNNGFIGWMQGTGKDPSAGQPLSYTRIPDFEDYGTGCVLLGATEYYKLLAK